MSSPESRIASSALVVRAHGGKRREIIPRRHTAFLQHGRVRKGMIASPRLQTSDTLSHWCAAGAVAIQRMSQGPEAATASQAPATAGCLDPRGPSATLAPMTLAIPSLSYHTESLFKPKKTLSLPKGGSLPVRM